MDTALDAAGGEALFASVELVKDKQRIGTLVEFEAAKQLGVRGIRSQRSATRLAELVELYVQGKLQVPTKAFPLERAADAHRKSETGHVRGKIVLLVDGREF